MKKQSTRIAVVTEGSSGIGLATAKELISEGAEVITTGGKVGLLVKTIQRLAGTIKNEIPVKRFGAPSDIAKLISFISSDDTSFITGLEYIIDGVLAAIPSCLNKIKKSKHEKRELQKKLFGRSICERSIQCHH